MASRLVSSLLGWAQLFLLLTISAVLSPLLSHFTNVNSQQRPADTDISDSKQTDNPTSEPAHWLVGSYYNTRNGLTATLLLNNKGIKPLEVRPKLFNMAGREFELPPVTVEPSSHLFVNLSEWAVLGGESFQEGNIKLFHYGKDLVLGAQIYLVNEARSLSFEEKLAELGKFDSRRLEGVWAMPSRNTVVEFALTNTTTAALSVTARLTRSPHITSDAQNVELQPHETRLLDLRRDFATGEHFARSEALALSLEHAGTKEALLARAFISDAEQGYSNLAQFSNPIVGKSKALHGAGLRLGTIAGEPLVPIVVVRNTSDQPASLTCRVPYTRTDGTIATLVLPRTRLKPNEISILDMRQVSRRSAVEDISTAGLEIEYDTPAGSVVVAAHTESVSHNHVFRVPMWDLLAQRSPTGGYPWRLEATSTTKAYIKNVTGREQDYVGFLLYENGSRYMIGIKTVQPHQTIELDVRALRDNQVPDETGVTIPLYVSSGQLQWTLRRRDEPARNSDELDRLALVGRSEQIDVIHGISSNYACQNCCGGTFLTGSIEPNNFQFDTGDVVEFRAYESGLTCYEYQAPHRVYPSNWSSTNPSVVTIGSNTGIATMLGSGSAQIKASWSVERSYENYPCEGGGYVAVNIGGEKIASEIQQSATSGKDIKPSIEQCGTCVGNWQPTNPAAGLAVAPTIAKLQYQSGSSYVDISGTLYVLKGTTVTFKAVPDPANATFPSNRPIWGGSSGASGTGTTKSVTFNTASTSTSDFKTVSAASGNIRTASVIVYELTQVLTPVNPSIPGRSLIRFGVEEGVALSFTASPAVTASQAGGLRWSISTTGAGIGTVSSADDGTGTYNAPDAAASISLNLKVLAGPSKDQERVVAITIVEPSGAYVTKFSGIKHFVNTWSAGFLGDIHITPADVSFYNLLFYEGAAPAHSSGWLLNYPQSHSQSQTQVRINSQNTINVQDEIFTGAKNPPYGIGEWYWDIPFRVVTNSGRTISLPDVRQLSTADNDGKAVISKGGASVSRVPTDPTSTY
jgi:hypothetical protein